MLVRELRQQNIVVFGRREGLARFLGAVTAQAGSPLVLVALHLGDGRGRVRRHFRQLLRVADARVAEGQQRCAAKEARAQHRERSAKAAADMEASVVRERMSQEQPARLELGMFDGMAAHMNDAAYLADLVSAGIAHSPALKQSEVDVKRAAGGCERGPFAD